MSDTYEVQADGTITVAPEAAPTITMEELEQREAFWEDELQRVEEDYIARKGEAEKQVAAIKAAIKAAKAQ